MSAIPQRPHRNLLRVKCPHCKAPPGRHCVVVGTNRPLRHAPTRAHPAREKAFDALIADMQRLKEEVFGEPR